MDIEELCEYQKKKIDQLEKTNRRDNLKSAGIIERYSKRIDEIEKLLEEFIIIVKGNRFDYGTSLDLVNFLNKPEIKKLQEKV